MKEVNDYILSVVIFDPCSNEGSEIRGENLHFIETEYGIKIYDKDEWIFYPWHTIRSYKGVTI